MYYQLSSNGMLRNFLIYLCVCVCVCVCVCNIMGGGGGISTTDECSFVLVIAFVVTEMKNDVFYFAMH